MLGLTLQDKMDLVDFLRNALTDPRTVAQAAPFDHPQLFTPNGHPQGANGYPVDKDPAHPGQAKNNFVEVPAIGAKGGKPLPTFLENLLNPPTPSSPPPPAFGSGASGASGNTGSSGSTGNGGNAGGANGGGSNGGGSNGGGNSGNAGGNDQPALPSSNNDGSGQGVQPRLPR
jgi:hypothetical protein